MQKLDLIVDSYSDSLFTNAHDLVSNNPINDGRGTFTHLGVRMEGLESARHLNFQVVDTPVGVCFQRNENIVNLVTLSLKHRRVARVEKVTFDTAFYTRNNVKCVYKLIFVDSASGKEVVYENIMLNGDSLKELKVDAIADKIILRLSEGGLARFHAFGMVAGTVDHGKDLLEGNVSRIYGISDASYGDPSLMLRPSREGNIMAGWESCRHSYRQKACIALKQPVIVKVLEIDTYMHCLNAFKYIAVLVSSEKEASEEKLPLWEIWDGNIVTRVSDKDLNEHMESNKDKSYCLERKPTSQWEILLPFTPLKRDTRHIFTHENGLQRVQKSSASLCLVGVPDGGIHRIGLYGTRE